MAEPDAARSAIEAKYRNDIRPLCETYCGRLSNLLAELVASRGIAMAHIEHRAKDVESMMAKIDRKGYSMADPFAAITDLCGVRIITYYADDASLVEKMIRDEFEIDQQNSLDKSTELAVDEFGYKSLHLVVRLKSPRVGLIEWRRFKGISAEIQVRSVLQHAWASVSHKLDYKKASQAPEELRRKLFRLSALFELADEEFAAIRDKSQTLAQDYKEAVDAGRLDSPVNLDSIRQYVTERHISETWYDVGVAAGMKGDPSMRTMGEIDAMGLRRFVEVSQAAGFTSLKSLDDFLNAGVQPAKSLLTKFNGLLAEKKMFFYAVGLDIATLYISLSRLKDLPWKISDGHGFRDDLDSALRSAVQNG